VPLGRWRWPAFAAAGAVVSGALLLPVTVLGWWAVRGATNRGVARLNVDGRDVGELVVNTMVVSVVAAIAAVVLVLPVAYLSTRHRSRAGGVSNALVVAGFALPGLVVALAITYWVLQAPGVAGLYQTFPLLVVAYVIHFGAQAMRAAQVAVAAVPRRLEDAARMLGAARSRRFRTLELPLMLPGLAAGAGLVLLSTMKELPATLLLAPIGFSTLATRVWSSAEEGFLAEAGLLGLVLVVVSGVLTWVLVIRRSDVLD
jgi:iron(III) transport system permease protein